MSIGLAPSRDSRDLPAVRQALGLREHATAEQHRHLMRIDLVVFRLAAVNGLHVEGVSEHEGDALAGAQVRQPGPR